jgi:hypothetical protein
MNQITYKEIIYQISTYFQVQRDRRDHQYRNYHHGKVHLLIPFCTLQRNSTTGVQWQEGVTLGASTY